MKLFTLLPARKDGTLKVRAKSGNAYVFEGAPLGCIVEDEDDIEHLQLLGFMDQEEFEAEAQFQRHNAAREKRRAAAGITSIPGKKAEPDDDEGTFDSGSGIAQEDGTPPTGRVRRASKATVVQS